MRPLAFILAVGMSAVAFIQAQAGQRLVRGEGRAVIAGKDLSVARKAALADALYDAASKLQSHVRGASLIDTKGVLQEESSMLVGGRFSGYHILFEGREGGAFFVRIEAVGVTDEEACGGKRVDLDIRDIRTRVAPGIQGQVQRNVAEGLARGLIRLGDGTVFRIIEYAPGVAPRNHRTNSIDYAVVLSGEIEMEMDGQVVALRAGDVLVQRGTIHDWINRSDKPCVIAFVLIDARPVELGGKTLPAHG